MSVQDVRKVCPTTNDDLRMQKVDMVASNLVNGYDGFSGVHNNLCWSLLTGRIFYTLNNKVIEENTQNRT